MSLQDWFEKGLSKEAYMETLEKHKDGFHTIYEQFEIPADTDFFTKVESKNLRAIILAEPWCGHCMLNIPIVLRLAEKANLPVKFLPRDENLELMDQYLTNGKSRTIPIMIFINEAGEEVAKWGPLAPRTKAFMDPLKAELPSKDAADFDEKFQTLIQYTAKTFAEDASLWQGVYDSMKETLEAIE